MGKVVDREEFLLICRLFVRTSEWAKLSSWWCLYNGPSTIDFCALYYHLRRERIVGAMEDLVQGDYVLTSGAEKAVHFPTLPEAGR